MLATALFACDDDDSGSGGSGGSGGNSGDAAAGNGGEGGVGGVGGGGEGGGGVGGGGEGGGGEGGGGEGGGGEGGGGEGGIGGEIMPVCGNGDLEDGEACDDGNLDDGDGCSSLCQIELPAVCGNGEVEIGEDCDDGNLDNGDGCSSLCATEGVAPGHNVEPDSREAPFALRFDANGLAQVTFGLETEGDQDWFTFNLAETGAVIIYTEGLDEVCNGDTQLTFYPSSGDDTVYNDDIGDGNLCSRVDSFEDPILGALPAGDHLIMVKAYLGEITGDNVLYVQKLVPLALGDACEGSERPCPENSWCDEICVLNTCGDGVTVGDEQCDDGNDVVGDGCEDCREVGIPLGAACTTSGPDCVEGAYCHPTNLVCTEPFCGDGVINGDELCDDGNDAAGDGCAECVFDPYNGAVEPDARDTPYILNFDANGRAQVVFDVQPIGDKDYFTFTLDAPTTVTVTTANLGLTGCNGDTEISLYSGADVASLETDDDDSPLGLCSLIKRALPAGTYTVEAFEHGNDRALGGNWLIVQQDRTLVTGDACIPNDPALACPASNYCSDETRTCTAHICGDGVTGPGEDCDDGNDLDGDGCESCEIADLPVGAACDPDGTLDCVDGAYCPEEGANPVCTAHECGDGVLAADEACDDGNLIDGDGCESNCQPSVAGDLSAGGLFEGAFAAGEFDEYALVLSESTFVTIETGVVGGAVCAQQIDTTVELVSVTEAGRTRVAYNDDVRTGVRCSQIARVVPAGTYRVVVRDYSNNDALSYTLNVTLTPLLGEGDDCVPNGELPCADGFYCPAGDTPVCVAHTCGDGVEGPAEDCDDGNDLDGDGCESCEIVGIPEGNSCDPDSFPCAEGLFCDEAAEGGPICAVPSCGDGLVGDGEQCDDGNNVDGDGCTQCAFDPFNGDLEPDSADAPYVLAFDENGDAAVVYEITAGDTDYFTFTLLEDSNVAIITSDLAGTSCPGDNVIGLYEEGAAEPFLEADDEGPGRCGQLDSTVDELMGGLFAGTYTIAVSGFDAEDVLGGGWLVVRLLDTLEEGDLCVPEDSLEACPAGTYCSGFDFICTAHECGDNITGPAEDCDDGNLEDGDGCSALCEIELPDVSAGGEFVGAVPAGGNSDFTFSVAQDGVFLTAEVTDGDGGCDLVADADPFMHLYKVNADDTLTTVVTNDEGGISPCSKITRELVAGDYLIRVRDYYNETGYDFTLVVDLALPPAEGEPCDPAGLACETGTFCAEGLDIPVCTAFLLEGELCDRAGLTSQCDEGLLCLMTLTPGEGECGNPFINEVEPNDGAVTANQVNPGELIVGSLPVADVDIFTLTLPVAATVRIETGDGAGSCAFDTRLYQVSGEILASQGVAAAITSTNRLAYDDDGGQGACSKLERNLAAGTHYFLVDEYSRDSAVARYVVSFLPLMPANTPCDASGLQALCAAGLTCTDADGDGDGVCL